jgi:hypothetical protein
MVGLLGCGCCGGGGGGGETPCDCFFHPSIHGPTAKAYLSCGFDDPIPDSVGVYPATPTGYVRNSRFNRFRTSELFLEQFGFTFPIVQKWTSYVFGTYPIAYMRQLWQFDLYNYEISVDSTVNSNAAPYGFFAPFNTRTIPGGTVFYTIGSRMECGNFPSDDTYYLGVPIPDWRYKHGLLVKQTYPWLGIPLGGVYGVWNPPTLIYAVWEPVSASPLYPQGIRVLYEQPVSWGTHNLSIRMTSPSFSYATIPTITVSLLLDGVTKFSQPLSEFGPASTFNLEWQDCSPTVRSYKGCAVTELAWVHPNVGRFFWNNNPADAIFYDNFVFNPIPK